MNPIRILQIFLILLLLFSNIASATIYEREQMVFGDVLFKIKIDTKQNAKEAFQEIEKGFAIVHKMNQIFSTYLADSESHKINALQKPIENYKPSKDFFNALAQGLRFSQLTDGYFDITYEMAESGLNQIRLERGKRISLLSKNLKINLTGLIKGYTVDKITERLKKNKNIKEITVAAGGDIRHFDRSGKTEKVRLYNPFRKKAPITVTLGNQAVSTSGFYERGRHIKNTRHSLVEYVQVSVVADTCLISDSFDNGMMFMPPEKIKAVLQKFPGTKVILYGKSGKIIEIQ